MNTGNRRTLPRSRNASVKPSVKINPRGEFGGGAVRLRGFPTPPRHGLSNANWWGIKKGPLLKAEKKHRFTIFPFVIPLEVSHFVDGSGTAKGQAAAPRLTRLP